MHTFSPVVMCSASNTFAKPPNKMRLNQIVEANHMSIWNTLIIILTISTGSLIR